MISKKIMQWCLALLISLTFGALLQISIGTNVAHAQEKTVTVTKSITAIMAGNGSVIIPPTQITNPYEQPIKLISAQPPQGCNWYNDGENKSIAPGTTLTINWRAQGLLSQDMAKLISQSTEDNRPIPIGSITYTYSLPQKTVFAVFSEDDGSLNFYNRFSVPQAGDQFEGKTATEVYVRKPNVISLQPQWSSHRTEIKSVTVVDEGVAPSRTDSWFANCTQLKTADLRKLDTSNVTNMNRMFLCCKKLTSLDLSTWDTSQVTNMSRMFLQCTTLKSIKCSQWDTSKVTDMGAMFEWCHKLTDFDISQWDTSQVTNMARLFLYCVDLPSLDVGNWNTLRVTDMENIFMGCYNLVSLNVDNWDTSLVTNMKRAFYACNKLESLNLENWDTSRVTTMNSMFYASDFPIEQTHEVSLQKITFGPRWRWVGTDGLLYPPIDKFYPGADRKWYDQNGVAYAPEEIPNNKAGTYYPLKSLVP